MLRTRLWMGALLIALAVFILGEERWLAPWYPVLFLSTGAACWLATDELLTLIDPISRPSAVLCHLGVTALLAANWRGPLAIPVEFWKLLCSILVLGGMTAFLREMWRFRGPNRIVERIAQTILVLFYLGVLPSFFLQLRWLDRHSTLALTLAVFVPKGNDIGAYFTGKFLTGRLLGRHRMTPLLSPKKTWQGALGGMIASCVVAVAVNSWGPIFSLAAAIGFGLTVGLAGVLGDLAESLIKRDRESKDASASVPGFGGVLDIIDSLLFAAPVAYGWLTWSASS